MLIRLAIYLILILIFSIWFYKQWRYASKTEKEYKIIENQKISKIKKDILKNKKEDK